MAKISLNKLNLKKVEDKFSTIKINEQEVMVRQFLPIAVKGDLVASVINKLDTKIKKPIEIEVFTGIALVEFYTNINFTEKQKEDPTKLYDTLEYNDVINEVIAAIPEYEYKSLMDYLEESIDNIYEYNTSFLGLMEAINTDYSDLAENVDDLQAKISNKENLDTLKNILTKLG